MKMTHKLITLMIAPIIMLCISAGAAFAEGPQALMIDAANRYDGMDKSFSQGYIPKVSGGAAKVVLPLVLDPQSGAAALRDDRMTVTPDYGDPSSSPFVFGNMETTVELAAHPVNGTSATVQAWLLSFSFPLEPHRTNGRYPLTFHVAYALPDGTACAQDFTVYVTIKDGVNPYATPKPAATPKPQPQPKLIVSRCNVDPSPVQAGASFHIDFDIQNTSETVNVRNILIDVKCEDTDLEPAQGGSIFVGNLNKSASTTLSCDMKSAFGADPGPHRLTISLSYEDYAGVAYTAGGELMVPVTQPVRIEFDKPQLPGTVNAGDTVPVSLNVFNLGKNTLYNVMCKLAVPGLLPEGSAFLGNMEPGSSKTAQIYVFAGTLDMSLDAEGNVARDPSVTDLYGTASGSINVTYEDEFGNKMSQQVALGTTIAAAPVPTETPEPEDAAPGAGQWWVSVAVVGAIIAAGSAAMLVRRKKRAKEAEADEAE